MNNDILYSVLSGKDISEADEEEIHQLTELGEYIREYAGHVHLTRRSCDLFSDVHNDTLYESLHSMYKGTFDTGTIESNGLFNSSTFNEYRENEEEIDRFMENPLEVQEGVFTCSRCKDNKTVSFELQTRAADEAATVYIQCVKCKKRWKA